VQTMKDYCVMCVLVLLVGCEKNGEKSAREEMDESSIGQIVSQVLVPGGEFIRGSNKEDDVAMRQQYGFPSPLFVDEHPQKKIHLDAFRIDRYEVTNKQFKIYMLKTRRMLPYAWMSNGYAMTEEQMNMLDVKKLRRMAVDIFSVDFDTRNVDEPALLVAMLAQQELRDHYPVTGVNWFAAKAFCEWRGARLPSEAEWEKAARGPEGFEYPWGNDWDLKFINASAAGKWVENIAPVGVSPQNKSPYGAYDMSGNVWEWVADWYQPYAGSEYQTEAFGKYNRVIRGGGAGYYALSYFFRGAARRFSEPEMESKDVGFRCVNDV